ncbi:MAG TPA: ABC transporter transmembrane domain-containing protein, partial [Petrotogaceae bacterium]|nr:ABC transporter transmembrane domain-containing protein [Petrotogaceae bacterium]
MIKKFISYYKPHRGLFYLDIICAFLISSSDLAYPMVTRYIINTVIPDKNLSKIFAFGLFLLLLYFARMVLEYIVGYYGHILGLRIQYDMRKEIFSHIQKLPISYFDNTKTGHLMSRVTNDLFEISETAHHAPEDLFLSIVKIIGAFILLCTINWQLTLIVFLII